MWSKERTTWELRAAWRTIKRDWWVIVLLLISALTGTGVFNWN